ncbi:glycosyltransferase [Owenweeksia hongkongensis]|uniref:glycosyltransferase n=1 Tax=Owenweeksia hongkongensis TaxID=253245 RepID=UPI003A8D469E
MIEALFYISILGILHTYLIYPLSMLILGKMFYQKGSTPNEDYQPTVEIIFAAYNEEAVIREKIIHSFTTKYPNNQLSVRIGSDASSDQTDNIISELQKDYPNLHFKRFPGRTGKAGILNQLIKESKAELIVFTDANIIFNEDTIPNLVADMQDPKVGISGGRIVYSSFASTGISLQESTYLNLENKIKKAESDLFGKAMGVEGGCYIIRKELFTGIPPLFFMEDFYISMATMQKRYDVLFNSDATCHEDASVYSSEEYKRKVRISIGNFQNLNAFKKLIITRFFPLGYIFLSHKVLRWFTPFFLLILIPTSLWLSLSSTLYGAIAVFYGVFIVLGALGILFSQKKWMGVLKYPGHFIHMNVALLKGFYIYLKGVKSNAWEPTKRNQQ